MIDCIIYKSNVQKTPGDKDNGMGSPGVVAMVLTKWGSLAKACKVATSCGGLDVDLEVGGGLPSQAASHVASEQSTFVSQRTVNCDLAST